MDTQEETKELGISWLEDIAEMARNLTTVELQHKKATIKGMAARSKLYVKDFASNESCLKGKLVKYFSAIEKMADEVNDDNLRYKAARIKAYVTNASKYIREHF